MKLLVFAYAGDFDAQVRFWRAALGVPEDLQGPNWAQFRVGDARLAIHRVRDEPRDTDAFHLSVVVEDLEAALERFLAAGASEVRGIQDEAFGRSAIVADPDGRSITLVEEER